MAADLFGCLKINSPRVFYRLAQVLLPPLLLLNTPSFQQSCAGIVQLGEEGHDVFVVEGPETGASIVTGLLNKW